MFILTKLDNGDSVAINLNKITRAYSYDPNLTAVFTQCSENKLYVIDMPFGMFVSKLQEAGLLEKE